jgi:predicted dehydrogenase
MSNPPRLAFVGVGWIGAMRLDSVRQAGTAEVAALCDPVPANLEAAREASPQAACFEDLDTLLAQAGDLALDGVVISTPNALHVPQAVAALEHGLAVFCQKPLAIDAEGARAVVRAARRAGCLLGVDYTYRCTAGAQALRRLVRAGELGRVFSLDLAFHNAYGPDKPWCHDPAVAGGGALMDLGVHLIDLAIWLLGSRGVRSVHGLAFRDGLPLAERGIDDFATVQLELEGRAAVSLAVSWNAHLGRDCAIRAAAFGSAGGAEFRNVGGSFFDFELERAHGRSGEIVVREGREALGRALVEWVERLAEHPGFDPEIEQAVLVSEAIDAVYGGAPAAAAVPLTAAPEAPAPAPPPAPAIPADTEAVFAHGA